MTTIPTAPAEWFHDKLAEKRKKLFPLGEGEDGTQVFHDVTTKSGKVVRKEFKVRAQTVEALLTTARSLAKHRVAELEKALPDFQEKTYGKEPPKLGEKRLYKTNKSGYLQINTKYIQEVFGTNHVRLRGDIPILQGMEYRAVPVTDKNGKPKLVQSGKNKGEPEINFSYETAVEVEYTLDGEIIIRPAVPSHSIMDENAQTKANKVRKELGLPEFDYSEIFYEGKGSLSAKKKTTRKKKTA